jgi:hypothetical protein
MQSTGVDVAPAVGLALEDIEGEGVALAVGPALSVAEAPPVGLAVGLGQGTAWHGSRTAPLVSAPIVSESPYVVGGFAGP